MQNNEVITPELVPVYLLTDTNTLADIIEMYLPITIGGRYTLTPFPDTVLPPNHSWVYSEETGEWTTIEDFRGMVMFSTEDKSKLPVTSLGTIPEGYTLETPTSSTCVWEDGWVD